MPGRLVIVESPYAGDVVGNMRYLRRVLRECALRGDSPYASHLMLPGALDDNDPGERALGIELGLRWRRVADCSLFYIDLGWSGGMLAARELYDREGYPYELRMLGCAVLEVVPGRRAGAVELAGGGHG